MMFFLSITGLFKTLLIIVGVIVVLRFLGRLATAKRNMEVERKMNEQNRKFNEEKNKQQKHVGKTEVLNRNVDAKSVEDVDFEEIV